MKLILQKLIARLEEVPSLNEVKIYNNQLSKLDQEDIIEYPAAFIELLSIDYTSLPLRNQYANMTVRIHVVGESLNQGSNDDYEIYDVKDEVNRYLYGFSGDIFSPLQRSQESVDVNHNNIYDYKIEYLTRFSEYIEPINPKTAVITAISVAYDLDIDNAVIRTGDNANYVFGPGANI